LKKINLILVAIFLFSACILKAQCTSGEKNIKISIQTDNFGSETLWTLKNQSGTVTYESGGPYTNITGGQLYIKNVCVPIGTSVIFKINDAFGDGICCSYGTGYYKVELYGYTYASGGEFGQTEETNFVVDTPATRDMSVTALDIMDYLKVGNTFISGVVKSMGTDTVKSYTINYSVNGGTPVTHSFTSQSIPPFTSVAFTHPAPYNIVSAGNYKFKVWASDINGHPDLNLSNDTMVKNIAVVSQEPQKYVLVEEATGAWCGNCPDGDVKLTQVLTSNPLAIGVSIHNGDAMSFADGDSVNNTYASSASYPSAYIDRFLFPNFNTIGLSRVLWSPLSSERMNHVSPVSVDVTNTYNPTTRVVNITVSATFYAALNEELRFNAYIVEDSVSGTGSGWDQVNNYNSTPGHPMQGMGNPIVGFYHRHVLKAMIGGAFGTYNSLPANIVNGSTHTKDYVFTLPAGVKEKDVRIIGMVQKYNSDKRKRTILNSKETTLEGFSSVPSLDFVREISVYPNPATESTYIYFNLTQKKNIEIILYNLLGQEIYHTYAREMNPGENYQSINTSKLTKGLYLIGIAFDKSCIYKKLIIE